MNVGHFNSSLNNVFLFLPLCCILIEFTAFKFPGFAVFFFSSDETREYKWSLLLFQVIIQTDFNLQHEQKKKAPLQNRI